ncbi:hypothetical protein [Francisella philomiragia]|uniref:hypothetical protein n=1 Tax=Francisella philomiragia TaxID=28110 RepID=UPI001B8BCF10|nr:hypothetical protein [Francisella philomiragia]QUE32048.1 hypothetical protein IMS64_03335 [Francisella philomiragia]
MKQITSFFVGTMISISLFSFSYSFNDTENLLYLQAYYNKQNVEKVNTFKQGSRMSRYSTNLKVDDYR